MAKPKLSEEEKQAKKLARRAAKKAKRLTIKNAVAAVEQPTTKKGKKGASPFHLIEIPHTDAEGMKRLAELREAGAPIRQVAYAHPYFVYEVPSSITNYPEHGTGEGMVEKDMPAEKPLKTITDLVFVVSEKIDNKEKVNKRQIKLLVRGSQLKRNVKKEAVTKLLKQFNIK
jgi:hypothetical protein